MCVCRGKLESVRQCFPISDFRFLLLFSVFFLFGAIRAERVSTLTYGFSRNFCHWMWELKTDTWAAPAHSAYIEFTAFPYSDFPLENLPILSLSSCRPIYSLFLLFENYINALKMLEYSGRALFDIQHGIMDSWTGDRSNWIMDLNVNTQSNQCHKAYNIEFWWYWVRPDGGGVVCVCVWTL